MTWVTEERTYKKEGKYKKKSRPRKSGRAWPLCPSQLCEELAPTNVVDLIRPNLILSLLIGSMASVSAWLKKPITQVSTLLCGHIKRNSPLFAQHPRCINHCTHVQKSCHPLQGLIDPDAYD